MGSLKDMIVLTNRYHPEWTARDIAKSLGTSIAYVRETAWRQKLTLARAVKVNHRRARAKRTAKL